MKYKVMRLGTIRYSSERGYVKMSLRAFRLLFPGFPPFLIPNVDEESIVRVYPEDHWFEFGPLADD